jgi:hypothetical protein
LVKLSFSQQKKLEDLISKYPDVLNQKLGLTHLMEYNIQHTRSVGAVQTSFAQNAIPEEAYQEVTEGRRH